MEGGRCWRKVLAQPERLLCRQVEQKLIERLWLAAGPTTAAGMAAAKGWRSSLTPALLIGIFGYTIATFVGVAMAQVYQRMQGL